MPYACEASGKSYGKRLRIVSQCCLCKEKRDRNPSVYDMALPKDVKE